MTRIEIVERTATLIGLRGLTERTTNDYLRKCRKLLDWIDLHGIQYEEVTYDQLLQYILYLKNDLDYAPRTINSTISFIRFLFLYVFNRPFDAYTLPRCKVDTTIPDILSRKEVGLFLNSIKNPKYRAVFAVMYSCGLRVREICALRYEDVSRERMKVHIRHGKNRSDRLVPISQAALNILTQYWYACGKPRGWLFPGQKPDTHITVNSVQRILKDTLKDLGWDDRKITSHTFRHSLGTHLYEDTHDLVYVQNVLGHKSIRSTTVYITLSSDTRYPNPLDSIWRN